MKDYWIEPEGEKLNKKKIIIAGIILSICLAIIILIIVYINNKNVRDWMDTYIFRKEIKQDNVTLIELKDIQYSNIYAFNKYIGILNKNKFSIYNNTGNIEKELEVQVSNPLFDSSNRFLAIAETKGQKVYLITDKEISWEADVEGNISQVYVNKNGYVAVVIVDTSYKAVIAVYDPQGKPLFKQYISSNRTTDISISNDNKYLAIAEVDTSGTIIQSSIRVITIEKAISDTTDSLKDTYLCPSDKLITNINYQDKNRLVCMYTDAITVIENGVETELVNNKDKKVIFQSIKLNNNITSIEEKSSGLFTADSYVNIINVENKSTKNYTVDSVAKEIYTYGDIIALNIGTQIEFINTGGWLVKRYIANQEITNIVVSDNIAGVVYRDKIEIINL